MKLLVISSKLHRGGAESHTLGLVNQIARVPGVTIDLFVTQRGGNYESGISKKVRVLSHPFNISSYSLSLLFSAFRLISMRRYYDRFVAVQDGPIILSLLVLSPSRTTIVVQNNPKNWMTLKIGFFYNLLSKYLYYRSAGLISLSDGVLQAYQKRILLPKRVKVIPNLVQLNMNDRPLITFEKVNILSIGRLTGQKDYPTALRVIKRLRTHYKVDLHYVIVGNGELEDELRGLAVELGVEDIISFEGYQANVEHYYNRANIFLLTSKYEGFGNVIVEAQSYGLPVVSTNCDYGPSEILKHELSEWLAPVGDIYALSSLLYQIIVDPMQWEKLSIKSYDNSRRYEHSKLAKEYIDFIA